ncbi:unnamed protein product, partial [Ilex paraguariensis]
VKFNLSSHGLCLKQMIFLSFRNMHITPLWLWTKYAHHSMLFTNTAIASNVAASNATTSSADAASTAGPASTVAASTAVASTAGQALIAGAACTVGHKSGAVGRCSGNGVVDKYIQLVQPARNVHKTSISNLLDRIRAKKMS